MYRYNNGLKVATVLSCAMTLCFTGCAKNDEQHSSPSAQAPSAVSSPTPAQTTIIPIPQTSPADDVRKAVIQATPEMAASRNGGTIYDANSLKPKVEVSLTSATEAKCRLSTYMAPTATSASSFFVNLTKYDTGWKVDDYKFIAVEDQPR